MPLLRDSPYLRDIADKRQLYGIGGQRRKKSIMNHYVHDIVSAHYYRVRGYMKFSFISANITGIALRALGATLIDGDIAGRYRNDVESRAVGL